MRKYKGGVCKQLYTDADSVIYEYFAYQNTNQLSKKNFDGLIEIKMSFFKQTNVNKRGKIVFDGNTKLVSEALKQGEIYVVDCSNCIYKTNGVGSIAFKLCCKLLKAYQQHKEIPVEIQIFS